MSNNGPSKAFPTWMLSGTETIKHPPLRGWETSTLDMFAGTYEYISPSGHHYYTAELPAECECCGRSIPPTWIAGRWDWKGTARTMRKLADCGSLMEALQVIAEAETDPTKEERWASTHYECNGWPT